MFVVSLFVVSLDVSEHCTAIGEGNLFTVTRYMKCGISREVHIYFVLSYDEKYSTYDILFYFKGA